MDTPKPIELNIFDEQKTKNSASKPQRKRPQANNFTELFDNVNNWLVEQSEIPLQDKLQFFQLLSTMIDSGMPITSTIELLEEQAKNPKLKLVIRDIRDSISQGLSLAEAFEKNNDVFDDATAAVVEAGERSGKLQFILRELVTQYEQRDRLSKQVKSVMIYPIVVIVSMILLGAIVLIFVVPKLVSIFEGSANLPLPTQIMIGMSDFLISFWWVLLLIIGLVGYLFTQWKKTRSGQRVWSTFLFSLPMAGPILQKMILSRFTRIFGFLTSAGVPIIDGLRISASVAENDFYEERILLAADDLSRGISIAENLSGNEKLFPKMLVNMIAVGEKSAALDRIMNKAADFFTEEVERQIGSLSKILEPIILAFIAAGAVFMLLAVYLPILQLNDRVLG